MSYIPLLLPRAVAVTRPLTADGLHAVIASIGLLDPYNFLRPGSPSDLALHRIATGAARTDDADAVLDFTIALEALQHG
jgi:hypothetical protein